MEEQSNSDHLSSSLTDLMTSLMVIFILLLLVFISHTASKDAALTDVLLAKLRKDLQPQGFTENTIRPDPRDRNAILVIVPGRLMNFQVRKADLSDDGRDFLKGYIPNLAHILCSNEYRSSVESIVVEGHTDSTSWAGNTPEQSQNKNLALSQQRSMAVVEESLADYEWIDRNPIQLVRQSAKRERIPDVLELTELQLLLSKLAVRERTLALLDAATGLRVSELLALRWRDIDFETLELSVTRSIWHQVVGDCKTEASAKPVPMDEYMAEDLQRWRRQSPYPMPDDWVFASPSMGGKQPYWPDNLMKRYIKPVARKAGIRKNIGWHTFRHSFGTLLKANGEDVKTVQELLRHANSRITLDVYTQAVNSHKRAAQSKVVRMMVPDVGQKASEKDLKTA